MALKINPYIEQEILEYSINLNSKSDKNHKINDNSKYITAKTKHIGDKILIDEKQNKKKKNTNLKKTWIISKK